MKSCSRSSENTVTDFYKNNSPICAAKMTQILTFRAAAQAHTSQASHASTTTSSSRTLLFLSDINQNLSTSFPHIQDNTYT
jgi:hypothetical protein